MAVTPSCREHYVLNLADAVRLPDDGNHIAERKVNA